MLAYTMTGGEWPLHHGLVDYVSDTDALDFHRRPGREVCKRRRGWLKTLGADAESELPPVRSLLDTKFSFMPKVPPIEEVLTANLTIVILRALALVFVRLPGAADDVHRPIALPLQVGPEIVTHGADLEADVVREVLLLITA